MTEQLEQLKNNNWKTDSIIIFNDTSKSERKIIHEYSDDNNLISRGLMEIQCSNCKHWTSKAKSSDDFSNFATKWLPGDKCQETLRYCNEKEFD